MKEKNFTGIPKELQPWEGFSRNNQAIKINVLALWVESFDYCYILSVSSLVNTVQMLPFL